MIQFIFVFFQRSIKARLLLSFILLSILPILLVGIIPYQKSQELVKGQMLEFAQSTVSQVNENINYHLKDMELMSRMIYYQLFAIMEKETENGNPDFIDRMNKQDFNDFLKALKNNRSFIDEIHIQIEDQSFTTAIQLNQPLLEDKEWYRNAKYRLGEKSWIGPHRTDYSLNEPQTLKVISLLYPFILPKSDTVVTVLIEIKYEILDNIFKSSNLKSLGTLVLIDKYGYIIYSTDPTLMQEPEAEVRSNITNTSFIQKLHDNNSFIYDINFFSGWKVAAIIPNNQIEQSFAGVRQIVPALLAIFLLISSVLGWTLADRFIKPLRQLQRNMRQVEQGNFSKLSSVTTYDEIGDLRSSFNQMVEEIKTLIAKVAENERKKKQIEMRSLQYQINPHFLYNTLNSVQWLAKLHKIPDVSEMLTILIKLLRSSLNSSSYLHMLEEELEILSYYVKIQKYRYGEQFHVHYNIEPQLLTTMVPQFILQPLVENACFHAFSDGMGTIVISAIRRENMTEIRVEDNGRGMPQETLRNILHLRRKEKNSSGIGIKNVDEKIKIYFGEQFGLKIQSEEGKGTTIVIRLPVTQRGQDEEQMLN